MAYARGYKSSQRSGGLGGTALEAADGRREPSAWYDGYHDHAADRPKWTSMHLTPLELDAYNAGIITSLKPDGTPTHRFDPDQLRALLQDHYEEQRRRVQLSRTGDGFVPVGLEQQAKDREQLYGLMSRRENWDLKEDPHFPVDIDNLAVAAIENSDDSAIEAGFMTPDGKPVPPITPSELSAWKDHNAAQGLVGLLDSYGYDANGNLYGFNQRHKDAMMAADAEEQA